MPRALLVLLLLCGLRSAAFAGSDELQKFAHFFAVEEARIDEVRGYRLPKGAGFTHLLVGRMATTASHHQGGAVLMRCDEEMCMGTTVYLDVDAEVHVQGVVDLNGDGAALEPRTELWRSNGVPAYRPLPRLDGARRLRVPALVVELRREEVRTEATRWRERVTGTARRHELQIVPLEVAKDTRPHWVFRETTLDRGVSGAGTSTSYRLARGKSKHRLDIVATEQQHLDDQSICLPPPPTTHRYVSKDGRYVLDTGLDRLGGCH